MAELLLAACFLLLTHFGISSTGARPWLIGRIGTGRYLGLYSALAFLAFIWLASAYSRAGLAVLWPQAAWQAWLPILIIPFALILLVGGLTTPNPTAVGAALVKKAIDPPKGVLRITRHPAMWAFALWALTHLIANGDAASLILFGTIAVLALAGTMMIDARYRARLETLWPSYAGQTSNLPFAAIAAGRQKLDLAEIGWWRVALALALFILLLALHPWLFGVSPFAMI